MIKDITGSDNSLGQICNQISLLDNDENTCKTMQELKHK
jgi:hypothetical protein